MVSQKKKFHLHETDLARAATAPANRKEAIIRQATGDGGYDRYRGVRQNLGPILNVRLPLALESVATREQIKAIVGRSCNNGPGEVDGNIAIADGLLDFVDKHVVSGEMIDLEPVILGPAGRCQYWSDFVIKIDGKRCIPYIDLRGITRLSPEARRFVFSVNHTHIRLANPTEYSEVGFVIVQFDDIKDKKRKVVLHFDDGVLFWNDSEIGDMIDEVYRLWSELRKAA